MEAIPRILLVGLALTCFANAFSDPEERSSPTSPIPWRGSAVLSYSSSEAYETPTTTSSSDEYSSPEPYSSDETWYLPPSISEPSSTPRPQYSAIVTVRTTTWVLSRSTTITSIILETYYSTLTAFGSLDEGGTVTETAPPASTPCAAASSHPSVYGNECSPSSSSSSLSWSTSSSDRPMTTITWSPEVTAYPLPSRSDDGRASPASTSTTSSASTATTATKGNETPPVVAAGGPPLPKADARALGAAAALLAILV